MNPFYDKELRGGSLHFLHEKDFYDGFHFYWLIDSTSVIYPNYSLIKTQIASCQQKLKTGTRK